MPTLAPMRTSASSRRNGWREAGEHPIGQPLGGGRLGEAGQEDGELVTAEPATVSPGRTLARSRAATCRRSSSPAA